jgi:hypothetical protein
MIQAKLYFEKELPTGGSAIPMGIHDKGDVKFLGLRKTDNYWDIRFGNTAGQFVHHRLFEPDANFSYEGETPSEALQRSIDKNVRITVDVLRVFLGEMAGNLEADTYEEFMQLAADSLEPFVGSAVCIKVIPDARNEKYTKLTNYKYVDAFVEGFPTSLYWTKKEKEKYNID